MGSGVGRDISHRCRWATAIAGPAVTRPRTLRRRPAPCYASAMLRVVALAVSTAVALVACSSDDDSDDANGGDRSDTTAETGDVAGDVGAGDTDDTTAEPEPGGSSGPGTSAPSGASTEETTTGPSTPTTTTASTPGDPPASGTVPIELDEWVIEAPTAYRAGAITFEVTNAGTFVHELVVVRGESYESLPLAANGAIVEDDLEEGALVGRTPRIDPGGSETLTLGLDPGDYVLVCNISSGPSSHAAQGQRLAVTVG